MSHWKRVGFILVPVGLLLILSSCHMGRSDYSMTEEQRQQFEAVYDSLQHSYRTLIDRYETSTDSVPDELRLLYTQMQNMHQEMDINHRQMMSMHMDRHMQGGRMMAEGMGMHMQSHMTGEWYRQMISMHEQMASLHEQQKQDRIAKMNRHLAGEYGRMMQMIPGLDEPAEVPSNEEGDPALLNGENLYARNCASCHGENAEGIGGVFPPLDDSEWVTGDKSIPIRILLNGLTGSIEVNNRTYRGTMPSFKARLSTAEMAAILNYLRTLDDEDHPEITQEDVIRVAEAYNERTSPWTAGELTDD